MRILSWSRWKWMTIQENPSTIEWRELASCFFFQNDKRSIRTLNVMWSSQRIWFKMIKYYLDLYADRSRSNSLYLVLNFTSKETIIFTKSIWAQVISICFFIWNSICIIIYIIKCTNKHISTFTINNVFLMYSINKQHFLRIMRIRTAKIRL